MLRTLVLTAFLIVDGTASVMFSIERRRHHPTCVAGQHHRSAAYGFHHLRSVQEGHLGNRPDRRIDMIFGGSALVVVALRDAILVLNAGPSSIKFSLAGAESQRRAPASSRASDLAYILFAKGGTDALLVEDRLGEPTTHEAPAAARATFEDRHFVAAGHQVVHDGSLYSRPRMKIL
jgi:hypothetical protein